MVIPEMVSVIKDNQNCNNHGMAMYMQMIEYVAYDGDYNKDTNTFSYTPDGAESYADSGEMYWLCGHCDRTLTWLKSEPTAEAQ